MRRKKVRHVLVGALDGIVVGARVAGEGEGMAVGRDEGMAVGRDEVGRWSVGAGVGGRVPLPNSIWSSITVARCRVHTSRADQVRLVLGTM